MTVAVAVEPARRVSIARPEPLYLRRTAFTLNFWAADAVEEQKVTKEALAKFFSAPTRHLFWGMNCPHLSKYGACNLIPSNIRGLESSHGRELTIGDVK